MQRITPDTAHPLFNTAATRAIEQRGLAALPPHTLMQRAGLASARLALALAPHARQFWVACGTGHNGGDGLEAAAQLRRWGRPVSVTWLGRPELASADTRAAWQQAQAAGVQWTDRPPILGPGDLAIDALLGLGLQARGDAAPPPEQLLALIAALNASPAPTLALDLPSGLDADHGTPLLIPGPGQPPAQVWADHTLSLLTLKPGLYTHHGRDAAGQVWLDTLEQTAGPTAPTAWLSGPPLRTPRRHASHKGSQGDVQVIGGEGLGRRGMGMGGAALLAGRAALQAGAGRVLVALLDGASTLPFDPQQPELMLRRPEALDLRQGAVVCGCGGGEAIQAWIEPVLTQAGPLVLDADALNAIATRAPWQALLRQRSGRGLATVLTPHPLEAARLLACDTAEVQARRLAAAQALADQMGAVVVLKGSGSVIAGPGRPPALNPTGNARLATAGTGDVLAGLVGALLATGRPAFAAAQEAAYRHGAVADAWTAREALTASALAQALGA